MKSWLGVTWALVLVATTLPSFAQQQPAQAPQPAPPSEQPVDLTQQGPQSSPPAATQAPTAPPQSAPPQSAPPPGYGAPPPGYAPPPPGYPAAYEPPPPPPPPEPEPRTVSLTLAPLYLFLPVVEVMAELRIINHLGVAGFAGYGSVTLPIREVDSTTGAVVERDLTSNVLDLGLQGVWYPIAPFDSLELGVQFEWAHAEATEASEATTRGLAFGVAVGPFIGYKEVTSVGFTFLVQGGIKYAFLRTEPKSANGTTSVEEDSGLALLLTLNIGWSF